jgi:hypothetical protein
LVAISTCPVAAMTVPSGGQEDCPLADSSLLGVVGERWPQDSQISLGRYEPAQGLEWAFSVSHGAAHRPGGAPTEAAVAGWMGAPTIRRMRRWLRGNASLGVADLLWLAGLAIMAGAAVFLACGSIVTFGVAGRDESLGHAFLCLVYAALAVLLGRWCWMNFRRWMEHRSER